MQWNTQSCSDVNHSACLEQTMFLWKLTKSLQGISIPAIIVFTLLSHSWHNMTHKLLRPPTAYSLLFRKPLLCQKCSFLLWNTIHVPLCKDVKLAFYPPHITTVLNFRIRLDETSRVCFCWRLPSLPSSKGALQLPFLQSFKGTTTLKRPKFAISSTVPPGVL